MQVMPTTITAVYEPQSSRAPQTTLATYKPGTARPPVLTVEIFTLTVESQSNAGQITWLCPILAPDSVNDWTSCSA